MSSNKLVHKEECFSYLFNSLHEQSPLCLQFPSYEQQLVLLPPAEVQIKQILKSVTVNF